MFTLDELVDRNERVLQRGAVGERTINNLKTWLDDAACVASAETEYLDFDDLMTIGPSTVEGVPDLLCNPLEDVLIWTLRRLGRVSHCGGQPVFHISC